MARREDLRARSDRIEQLVGELACGDRRCAERAEELLGLVCELYGEGLARVVELAAGFDLLAQLAEDEVIASLLLVHGLHPEPLPERVRRALDSVRPLLASHGGDVELLAIDPEAGTVRLRLLGSCDGCPSSAVTLRLAVERAVLEAAPEVLRIELADVDASPAAQPGGRVAAGSGVSGGNRPSVAGADRTPSSVPIALRPRPVYDQCPTELKGA